MIVILKLMLIHMYLYTYLFGCIQLSTVVTYRHLEAGYSPPGSSVHGILQARILEWAAMASSRSQEHRVQKNNK